MTENINQEQSPRVGEPDVPAGRLMALDLGQKRVGVAVSDELQITVRPLAPLRRTNWKQLLRSVADSLASFDARALVIGLPLRLDGSAGDAAEDARRIARNFRLSLGIPVFLQDEKLTSVEALSSLRAAGYDSSESLPFVDSESAAIILRDFIAGRVPIKPFPDTAGEG
ncbi:MAG TPA: Holliday junction resolvase RuvX [Pyrinomonadaceae bacterium]